MLAAFHRLFKVGWLAAYVSSTQEKRVQNWGAREQLVALHETHGSSDDALHALCAIPYVCVRATHLEAKLSSRESVHDEDHARHGEQSSRRLHYHENFPY